MKTEVQEKFESFQKKEKVIRRISILLAIIPFFIGLGLIWYTATRVKDLNDKYIKILDKKNKAEALFNFYNSKNQQLELKLNYGLSIDSTTKISVRMDIMKKSDSANLAIERLMVGHTPDTNITITYYSKTIEAEKTTLALKSLGYDFKTKNPSPSLVNQKTNSVWFGRNVNIKDCKIVALALIRAGIDIKAIRSYRTSSINPAYKANIIEIGGDKNLENQSASAMTVSYIENAKIFPRDHD